ncbi:MAG: hypothetical protein U0457_14015 [Candidatus Sericytochromatia bacterium]
MKTKKILIKTLIFSLLSLSLSFNVYANELKTETEKNEKIKEYEAKWATVLQLQRMLENGFLKESVYYFSNAYKEKIAKLAEKEPDFYIRAWKLEEARAKWYKNKIFNGGGLFIFEDGEWKINEY